MRNAIRRYSSYRGGSPGSVRSIFFTSMARTCALPLIKRKRALRKMVPQASPFLMNFSISFLRVFGMSWRLPSGSSSAAMIRQRGLVPDLIQQRASAEIQFTVRLKVVAFVTFPELPATVIV